MGVIMGTAAYMSPEQARGKPVDKRADIWAFGAVLFEMLTGRRPFGGDQVSDTLAALLRAEPDWDALPPGMPARLTELIQRCLQKQPHRRMRDIGDVRLVIDGAFELPPAFPDVTISAPLQVWQRSGPAVSIALALMAMSSLAVWSVVRPPEATGPRLSRFVLDIGTATQNQAFDVRAVPVWSPTGTQLALNQVRFYVNKGEKPVVQVVRQESRTPTQRLFR